MEGDVDATANAVDQPYLARETCKKHSSGKVAVEPTQYIFSEALTTDVGSQPDASVIAQPLLTPVSTTAFQVLAANLAYRQLETVPANTPNNGHGHLVNPSSQISVPSITPLISSSSSDIAIKPASALSFSPTTTITNGEEVPISSTTGTDQQTLTTDQNTISGQTGLTSSTTPSSSPNASQMKAIAGGVTGASVIVILGAIVFCILRRQRRYRAARSVSSHEVPTFSDIPGQSMPQSARLPTTPQPFLDFRLMQNRPSSKGIITGHASLLTRNNQGDIEQAADPFKDPVPAAESLSNNDDEVQRVRDTLDRLQALTSRFEREVQQLGVLAKSGQLSAEDRLRLEEIRRTTGLKIPWDSRYDRISMAESSSSGSSSSPPSYHTHGS